MQRWPFWAATADERIDTAFDLADLRPGERFVDLGCGDGRVLLRAAVLRGAKVRGVELDPELARAARALLAAHEVDGQVAEADLFTAPLDGDVVFCYLSPAVLQRLRTRLEEAAPGTRLVTVAHMVPGWEPDAVAARCYLYRLPATRSTPDLSRRGWHDAGVVAAVRPEATALIAAVLAHEGGPVEVAVHGDLSAGNVRTGADHAAPGEEVVVDIEIPPRPAGTLTTASLDAAGLGRLSVVALATSGEPALRRLDRAETTQLLEAAHRGDAEAVAAAARADG